MLLSVNLPVHNTNYTIRQFTADEIDAYKNIRLEALQQEPWFYGMSHAAETAMHYDEWVDRVTNPLHARFGLYADGVLIGLTGIIINKDKTDEAYMTQSYIRKEHRGKKLSRMLYDGRIAWAKEHDVKRLEIAHKESNTASKAANQHYGFVFTHKEPRAWPDGSEEDNYYYELFI